MLPDDHRYGPGLKKEKVLAAIAAARREEDEGDYVENPIDLCDYASRYLSMELTVEEAAELFPLAFGDEA